MKLFKWSCQALDRRALTLLVVLSARFSMHAAETGQAFASPEAAVTALISAVSEEDPNALRKIFGPDAQDLENPDRVQATNDFREFLSAFNQTNRIIRGSDSEAVLEVGGSFWPFPVPMVKRDGNWFFDTEAGKEELLNRRIGRNERLTLEAVRAYVEAQREYSAKDRDGDRVLEFAQKILSTPGKKDGLYWPMELDGEVSPLGPMVAQAQAKGYRRNNTEGEGDREPFNGYYFKILTRQGKSAPGGKYDYIINDNMIGGFALVAWPAEYGQSGIMTFIVNQEGEVYQKDLGPKTAKTAEAMKAYNPDASWTISHE